MGIEVWCQTDIGMKRERNEDAFLVDRELGLFMVADGMGGHRGGDMASKMAVETVRDVVARYYTEMGNNISPKTLLSEAYKQASNAIFDKSNVENPELRGMGTTLVVAFHHQGTLYIGNVGDSRAYLSSKPYFWQITEDHSLVNEQLKLGLISEENIDNFVAKNVITRSVGFERDVECDVIERNLKEGEMVLMCSDGLSGLVSDERIAEMCHTMKPAEIVPRAIEEAKQGGGDDNITCMVLFAKP